MDGFDDLGLIQFFTREARHAPALLDETNERRSMEEPGHFDHVVHEVAVQASHCCQQHVVAPAELQAIECQELGRASLPAHRIDELEEMVMQRRQPPGRLGLQRNRSSTFARLIPDLHDGGGRGELLA